MSNDIGSAIGVVVLVVLVILFVYLMDPRPIHAACGLMGA